MAKIDVAYHELLDKILTDGYVYEDPNRKGTYRTEIDEYTIRHDLTKEFPAITTKELYWKGIVGELLWFLRGETNIKYLVENGIHIWDKDAYRYVQEIGYTCDKDQFLKDVLRGYRFKHLPIGQLGRVYGAQWRRFNKGTEVDQFANLIYELKNNPLATDHIITAWNPAEIKKMALKPCHYGFQIMVRPLSISQQDLFKKDDSPKGWTVDKDRAKYGFTLKWQQRSVDTFLGLPFNIASYALLAHIIGKLTNMVPLKLVGSLSKVHIYDNAIDQAKEQLSRDVDKYKAPTLGIKSHLDDFTGNLDGYLKATRIQDFMLLDYESYPSIKAKMLSYNK